jgi:hypothetical protein
MSLFAQAQVEPYQEQSFWAHTRKIQILKQYEPKNFVLEPSRILSIV